MGFIDITDKYPIKFHETLIGLNSYAFDRRFIKSAEEMITMILINPNKKIFLN